MATLSMQKHLPRETNALRDPKDLLKVDVREVIMLLHVFSTRALHRPRPLLDRTILMMPATQPRATLNSFRSSKNLLKVFVREVGVLLKSISDPPLHRPRPPLDSILPRPLYRIRTCHCQFAQERPPLKYGMTSPLRDEYCQLGMLLQGGACMA